MERLVLLAKDEIPIRNSYEELLGEKGYIVHTTEFGVEALKMAEKQDYCVVVLDVLLPLDNAEKNRDKSDQTGGIFALQKIRQLKPWIPIVMFSIDEKITDSVIRKIYRYDNVSEVIQNQKNSEARFIEFVAKAEAKYQRNRKELTKESDYEIVRESPGMKNAVLKAREFAKIDEAHIMITGKPGVGKKLIATEIWKHSPCFGKPFVMCKCLEHDDMLLVTRTLGVKTRIAINEKRSLLDLLRETNHGTLLFEEIELMHQNLQAQLIGAIERQEDDSLDDSQDTGSNIRFIFVSCKLPKEIDIGEELRNRIQTYIISIPDLSSRLNDIGPLVKLFVKKFNQRYHRQIQIDKNVILQLESNAKSLSNNIRGLIDITRYAFNRTRQNYENIITENNLSPLFSQAPQRTFPTRQEKNESITASPNVPRLYYDKDFKAFLVYKNKQPMRPQLADILLEMRNKAVDAYERNNTQKEVYFEREKIVKLCKWGLKEYQRNKESREIFNNKISGVIKELRRLLKSVGLEPIGRYDLGTQAYVIPISFSAIEFARPQPQK